MSSIIFIFSVFFAFNGFTAAASKIKPPKGNAVELVAKSGTIILLNQKKASKDVSDFSNLRIDLVSPGFKRLFRTLAGDQRLVIYNGADEYSFLITRKSFNAKNEFSTHKQYTGQNYHIQMTKEFKDFKSNISEKIISCTYSDTCLTSRSTTDSDGNTTTEMVWESCDSYGKQKARVDDQSWLEREKFVIYNESNQVHLRTFFGPKENQVVLAALTTCR
jgi:hypothetical protein